MSHDVDITELREQMTRVADMVVPDEHGMVPAFMSEVVCLLGYIVAMLEQREPK